MKNETYRKEQRKTAVHGVAKSWTQLSDYTTTNIKYVGKKKSIPTTKNNNPMSYIKMSMCEIFKHSNKNMVI